jgi:heme-degrading monooxygenase HmoA
MVIEVAMIPVLAGHERKFEAALDEAVRTVLAHATGFQHFHATGWCVERPNIFAFQIAWESLEDHTVGFRGSDLFTQWRALIGPHFDGAPVVEHFAP